MCKKIYKAAQWTLCLDLNTYISPTSTIFYNLPQMDNSPFSKLPQELRDAIYELVEDGDMDVYIDLDEGDVLNAAETQARRRQLYCELYKAGRTIEAEFTGPGDWWRY